MGRRHLACIGLISVLLATPVFAFEFPALRQPAWNELSAQQRQTLAPLGPDWDQMDDARRKKWVGIAGRYPYLTADEQARIQRQMREWANLSPQQRMLVREKYKALRQAPQEKRESLKEQWARYQELPNEEKERLQQEAKQRAEAQKRAQAQRIAAEKKRKTPPLQPSQTITTGYPIAPQQQAPAPVITLTPSLVPTQPATASQP